MKKYRLAKDLPFAKVGSSIERLNANWYVYDEYGCRWLIGDASLDMDGWIEEIKPREFYLIVDAYNGIVTAFNNEKMAEANRNQRFNSHVCKIIKVREALDENS